MAAVPVQMGEEKEGVIKRVEAAEDLALMVITGQIIPARLTRDLAVLTRIIPIHQARLEIFGMAVLEAEEAVKTVQVNIVEDLEETEEALLELFPVQI